MLKRQVSTGIVFSIIIGALIALGAAPIITLLRTDPAIRHMAAGYLRIIMTGLVFSFIYNYLASMLRSMGIRAAVLDLRLSAHPAAPAWKELADHRRFSAQKDALLRDRQCTSAVVGPAGKTDRPGLRQLPRRLLNGCLQRGQPDG